MTNMGKQILLLGAGRSSGALIDYLSSNSQKENWKIVIASNDLSFLKSSTSSTSNTLIIEADVIGHPELNTWITQSDLVISMLPAKFHDQIAQICLKSNKHFISASYVSDEMKKMNDEAKSKNLLFLNECGLDPGLDHISALKVIHEIQEQNGVLTGFESFTGGLIAPASDNNPWNYKITWNPRNVVLAGQGGVAQFIQNGTYKYIPYQKLFRRTELIDIPGYGKFEGYANRDSLKYRELYNLNNIQTLFRGTLRKAGFCKAWDLLIQLGMTDDSYQIPDSETLTYRQFTNLFLAYNITDSVEIKFQRYLNIAQDDFDLWDKIKFLGLFDQDTIGIKNATPAQILQKRIEEKWKLESGDKDMIVMWHKFSYELNGKPHEIQSSLVVEGENQSRTAMSITVGLPLGIAAKLLLQGKIKTRGVKIPIEKEIYLPILEELKNEFGIQFKEQKVNPNAI